MQRATGTHHLPMAMPPVPEWAAPKAQDTSEHPPPLAFAREWHVRQFLAGQVHGAGRGDTLSLFQRDSVLHRLKKPFLVWVWLSECKRPISFPATSGEYSHQRPRKQSSRLSFYTRTPRKDMWSQMMANTRDRRISSKISFSSSPRPPISLKCYHRTTLWAL